ncbi:DMT family transporter [Streptomyces sp. NPDC001833]|uniref:DMT family transporter n=1 Tax=Streptomyces sp. NPDC001833 TaxID=3154658 RepID=UPI003333F89F
MRDPRNWILYAGLPALFWGVWGAFSSQPTDRYGCPNEMIYVILAITVLMAVALLRERIGRLAVIGVVAALIAIVFIGIPAGGQGSAGTGPWPLLSVLICVAWGAQAFFMRKAALADVNDATTFGWMTISGLLLVPVAVAMMGGLPDAPWQAPALTAGTQVLNAVGALFLVMALSRGKASVVAPITNALAPVLTIVLSLVVYQTLPTIWGTIGIALALALAIALGGSTLMVYADEKREEMPEPRVPSASLAGP